MLIRGFDRVAGRALAQEDGCQVLGRYPADKYRLTTEEAAAVLDALVDRAPRWMARLDQLPFDRRRIHRLRRAIGYRLDRMRR